MAANAEVLASLCAAELSYSHSDGRVEDKATFIANATSGKSKVLSLDRDNLFLYMTRPTTPTTTFRIRNTAQTSEFSS